MKKSSSMKSLIPTIKRNVGFMVMVIPVPHLQINRLLEILEVEPKVFLIDLINYFLYDKYDKNKCSFVPTIMEVPTHSFVEGASLTSEMSRMSKIILDWITYVDLSEFEEVIRTEHIPFVKNHLTIRPIDAFLSKSYVIVEFEVSGHEAVG